MYNWKKMHTQSMKRILTSWNFLLASKAFFVTIDRIFFLSLILFTFHSWEAPFLVQIIFHFSWNIAHFSSLWSCHDIYLEEMTLLPLLIFLWSTALLCPHCYVHLYWNIMIVKFCLVLLVWIPYVELSTLSYHMHQYSVIFKIT